MPQCNLLAFVPNMETEIIQIPKFLFPAPALTESNLSAPISSIIDFVPETNPATRNRTRDHLIAAALYSQMLYQLSYSRLASIEADSQDAVWAWGGFGCLVWVPAAALGGVVGGRHAPLSCDIGLLLHLGALGEWGMGKAGSSGREGETEMQDKLAWMGRRLARWR